jgi:sugar phosphate isomerase/epimerase
MWAIKTVPTLNDFFEFARRTAFARIELNHKITTAMLNGADLIDRVSSVHEPCPADISADELKKRDWLVSSLNEDCRREGVKVIQRSVDLAAQLHASTVVIHAGHVSLDTGLEKKLRTLIADGQRESEEYREIRGQMNQIRAASARAALEAVKNSILELLAYAEKQNVKLGIENRYHFMEIPSPDELEVLLSFAGNDRIGMLYDVGHAQALDILGFYPHEEWLERFGPRIMGTHLHDVLGTSDHYAPGLGNVDFSMVAAYLPENAFRSCEFQTFNTPEQVKAGLEFLVKQGCIKSRTKKDN